jgi:hypothetical protein
MEVLMLLKTSRPACVIAFGIVLLLSAAKASADEDNWTIDIGGGTSRTTGEISDRLTSGWNVDLRAGYEVNSRFGVIGDLTYNGLGVANQVLQTLQVPDGDAHMWSLTAGPVWRFPVADNVHAYVLGGVGWYRRTVEFTQPTVGIIDVIDPWWGYLGPALVQTNQVLGSVTSNALGAHAGGGVSLSLGDSGAEVFAEVRYHFANTKPTSTALVPVSFGMRWTGRRTRTSRP